MVILAQHTLRGLVLRWFGAAGMVPVVKF
jgi:hypothetical protein